jgi:predicted RNA-binding protein YlxR (DUF448 family)
MTQSTPKTASPSEKAGVKTHGKIKRRKNKQLDVKSRKAQREEVKVSRKSAKVGAETVRQCAVTRERKHESRLLRFVLDGQGRATPDIRRRLPGRGVWVTANRSVLAEAVKRGTLLRGLKAEGEPRVKAKGSQGQDAETPEAETLSLAGDVLAEEPQAPPDQDLPAVVEALFRRSALGALSLANKAGQLTLGFEAVARALASGGVVGLIHAADAAEDGRRKLDRVFAKTMSAKIVSEKSADASVADDGILDAELQVEQEEDCSLIVEAFSCEELSSALGRTNVMHAALKKGGASASFLKEAHRLWRYLEPAPAKPSKRRSKQDKV